MKRILKLFLLTILLTLLASAQVTYAQGGDNLYFEHLSVEDGLPHTNVWDILQDHHGFMWFTTEEGLAKYDGYEFIVYKHDPSDPNSLSSTAVYALYQDNLHNLWITTPNSGINKFDPATETFTHYQYDENDPYSVSSSSFYYCNIYHSTFA